MTNEAPSKPRDGRCEFREWRWPTALPYRYHCGRKDPAIFRPGYGWVCETHAVLCSVATARPGDGDAGVLDYAPGTGAPYCPTCAFFLLPEAAPAAGLSAA